MKRLGFIWEAEFQMGGCVSEFFLENIEESPDLFISFICVRGKDIELIVAGSVEANVVELAKNWRGRML